VFVHGTQTTRQTVFGSGQANVRGQAQKRSASPSRMRSRLIAGPYGMIPKTGRRFSEKMMCKQMVLRLIR